MQVENPEIEIISCNQDCLPEWNHPNLCAPYWRFYWNQVAGARVTFNNELVNLKPQICLAITPNTSFSSQSQGAIKQFYLHFIAAGQDVNFTPGLYPFSLTGDLQKTLDRIIQVLSGDNEHKMRLGALCHFLAAYAMLQVPAAKLKRVSTDKRVKQVISFLERNLSRCLNNPELAAMACMNTNAFIRLFKAETGIPPHAFLLRKRVEKSAFLLRDRALSIVEIALTLGFADRYHFSKAFKQHLGLGPAEFRRIRG